MKGNTVKTLWNNLEYILVLAVIVGIVKVIITVGNNQ